MQISGTASDMRTSILAAAIYLFSQRGFASTSMRDIAEVVGVKAPAIYNHFESKQVLLSEACSWSMDEFVDRVIRSVDVNFQPRDRLREILTRHVQMTLELGEFANGSNLLGDIDKLSGLLTPAARNRIHQQHRDYLDLVCQLMSAMSGRPEREPELRVVALSVLGMCDRVGIWYRTDGPLSPDQVAAMYWTHTCRTLGVPEDSDWSIDYHGQRAATHDGTSTLPTP